MNRRLTVWNPWNLSPLDLGEWDEWSGGSMDVKLDLYEKGDQVIVEMVAPGFSKDDIKLTVEGNMLTVSGNAKSVTEEENKDRKYYRQEISQRSFKRTTELPSLVDASKAEAHFKDGILKVNLPKREEAKPKSIEIKAS